MNTNYIKLTKPTPNIVEAINKWESDPTLLSLTCPNPNKLEWEHCEKITFTETDLLKRMEHHHIYLIYLNNQLIGEMNYMIDPDHLYKKESGTAWIGITIGESIGRGKGIGFEAIHYLEKQIKKHGLTRIELGVFEFNERAHWLYRKLGYKEIGRVDNFTYWQGKMWSDIRMEKYV